MNYKNFIFLFLASFILSCNSEDQMNCCEEDHTACKPELQLTQIFRLNTESEGSFQIKYNEAIDSSTNNPRVYVDIISTITGKIAADANDDILFLQQGDTLKVNSSEDYTWKYYEDYEIMSNNRTSDEECSWQNEWTLNSEFLSAFNYIGLYAVTSLGPQVGYVKITIDIETGVLDVVSFRYNDADFIVLE